MNNKTLTIVGLILLAGLLFGGGIVYGQSRDGNGWNWMGNGNGMGRNGNMGSGNSGMGFANGNGFDADMMEDGRFGGNVDDMMNQGYGGMMGNGMMGSGMSFGSTSAEPLTIATASDAVNRYITSLGDDNLTLGEVMIFDNHAYAQVFDSTTETGAFEVLVDSATGNVYPEPGPNMMWNNAYSPMSGMGGMGMMGRGMMGSSMGGSSFDSGDMMDGFVAAPEAGAVISAEDALTIAQRYLDTNSPNAIAEEPVAFPGYYTLHIEDDGEITGMLSVNAYSGQVFVHQWHGNFIEMTDDHR